MSTHFNPCTHVGCDTWTPARALDYLNFNPRTHVGCDEGDRQEAHRARGFQSTHPRGVRLYPSLTTPHDTTISIHAPTWGATIVHRSRLPLCVFQSTHPRGVRQLRNYRNNGIIVFQSTHPRGVRHIRGLRDAENERISIHAPTWGATLCSRRHCQLQWHFNPRTHVGCDQLYAHIDQFHIRFQSTHPRGVRHRGHDRWTETFISIHAPTWGAT